MEKQKPDVPKIIISTVGSFSKSCIRNVQEALHASWICLTSQGKFHLQTKDRGMTTWAVLTPET